MNVYIYISVSYYIVTKISMDICNKINGVKIVK